jgi:hypothetical protein
MLNLVLIALLLGGLQNPSTNSLTIVEEDTFAQVTDQGTVFSLTVKAILPDGSHALLSCPERSCPEIQSLPPEKRLPKEQACQSGSYDKLGYVLSCKYENLGTFSFKRKGDRITIAHRNGKTTLSVTSSW